MLKCIKCTKTQDEDQFVSIRGNKHTKTCSICRAKMRKYNSEPHNIIAINASKTKDERIAARKHYNKKYYEDVFKPKFKEYYQANRQRYRDTAKRRWDNVLKGTICTKFYETVDCGCGGHYKSHQTKRHEETMKHTRWVDEETDLWREIFRICVIDLHTPPDNSTSGDMS